MAGGAYDPHEVSIIYPKILPHDILDQEYKEEKFTDYLPALDPNIINLAAAAIQHPMFWDLVVVQKYECAVKGVTLKSLMAEMSEDFKIPAMPILRARLAQTHVNSRVTYSIAYQKEILNDFRTTFKRCPAGKVERLFELRGKTDLEKKCLRSQVRMASFWALVRNPLLWVPLSRDHICAMIANIDRRGERRNRCSSVVDVEKPRPTTDLIAKRIHSFESLLKPGVSGSGDPEPEDDVKVSGNFKTRCQARESQDSESQTRESQARESETTEKREPVSVICEDCFEYAAYTENPDVYSNYSCFRKRDAPASEVHPGTKCPTCEDHRIKMQEYEMCMKRESVRQVKSQHVKAESCFFPRQKSVLGKGVSSIKETLSEQKLSGDSQCSTDVLLKAARKQEVLSNIMDEEMACKEASESSYCNLNKKRPPRHENAADRRLRLHTIRMHQLTTYYNSLKADAQLEKPYLSNKKKKSTLRFDDYDLIKLIPSVGNNRKLPKKKASLLSADATSTQHSEQHNKAGPSL